MSRSLRDPVRGQLGLFDLVPARLGPVPVPVIEADPDSVISVPAPDLGERHYGRLVWVGRHALGHTGSRIAPSWCTLLRVVEVIDPLYPQPLYQLRVRHADGSVFVADRRLITNVVAVADRLYRETEA